ncbi:hypothetical protein FRC06_005891 [Ceratobasidium sp. 370]|nr:hypothetical protein FRC06_005891 [Ceratobasidium sp. 370]
MSHSARSSISDLSVQTLPLTPAPHHRRTPSRTYFSLAGDGFLGRRGDSEAEAPVVQGFDKLGPGESLAVGLSVIAVLFLAAVAATVTLLKSSEFYELGLSPGATIGPYLCPEPLGLAMVGSSAATAALRQRAKSETDELAANRSVSDPSASASTRPDVSPKQNRRSSRGTLSFLFAARPERSRTLADTSPKSNATPLDAPPNAPAPSKPGRQRTKSKPTLPAALLARSLTAKVRPLSRVEQSPTLPSIFASLPGRTRDSLRQSYEAPRRSFERPEIFALRGISPGPVDIPDPETPTPNLHSFRISQSPNDDDSPGRRSMASFARSPITSSHPMRRISALPLGGDDLFDSACEVYRASTADLSEFLRATGPEDLQRGVPRERGGSLKDIKDSDGANSTRSRTRSSLFRLGGRRREKSRPNGPALTSNDPLPPVPALTTLGLPAFGLRDEEGGDPRTSFSQILPMFGLHEEGVSQPPRQSLTSTFLPPNTREHRLPDGTTILMITTPQSLSESKPLAHSRSLNSVNGVTKEDSLKPSLLGSSNAVPVKPIEARKFKPLPPQPLAFLAKSTLKTHSPTMSISSDGTLSTAERPREVVLLGNQFAVPKTPTVAQTVSGHSSMLNLQSSYLQACTPTRPRGYSSPDPVSPPSAESTPTVKTPTPINFSPSASIAPTPELTPQKELVGLPESVPVVKVDLAPPRKPSLTGAIVVDGLHFPSPPDGLSPTRRRPTTMTVPRSNHISASPTRSSKSMRVTRSTRKPSFPEDDSQKARPKRGDPSMRPRPLNMEAVPTYREWKANAPEVQTQPGELTGLELDLNEGAEPGRKRNSLMDQQQLFLGANPFQTPPSPADPFLTPSLKNGAGAALPPLAGGPPLMPLPPSPSLLSQPPHSPSSPRPSSFSTNELPRSSLTPRRRSRVDSLMVRSSILFNSSPVSIPASLPGSSPVQALTSALSAQRDQFDAMSKYLVDTAKSFEEEKRAYELRIQELLAIVAEKEAKANEDERKIQGLEWLVGNLNLRAGVGKGGDNPDRADWDESGVKQRRRRSSFSGLGCKEDVPVTPSPIERAPDATERAKRTASMDDVFRNLGALSSTGVALGLNPLLTPPNIYEWAANTVLERD